jgi:enhancer of polycomb-like protein
MSTEDDVFLTEYNKSRQDGIASPDVFEQIMEIFEYITNEEAPYAAIDQTVIPFEALRKPLQKLDERSQTFAKDFYEFWKKRKQENGNRPLQPRLKFETHQDNDDGDPYVCFRRREVRQTRKTRARDVQSTEKLKRLRKELEEGRTLVKMVYDREMIKRDLMKVDRDIFETRAELKAIKLKTGIKADDDELLINQKVPSFRAPFGSLSELQLTSISPKRRELRTSKASHDLL